MTLKYKLFGKPGNLEEFLQKATSEGVWNLKLRIDTTRKELEDDMGVSLEDMEILGKYVSKFWLFYDIEFIDLEDIPPTRKKRRNLMVAKMDNKNSFVWYSTVDPDTGEKRQVGYKERLLEMRDDLIDTVEGKAFEIKDITDYELPIYQTLHRIP